MDIKQCDCTYNGEKVDIVRHTCEHCGDTIIMSIHYKDGTIEDIDCSDMHNSCAE